MKTSKFCLAVWKANPWPIGLFFLANFISFTIAPVILGYQMQWFFDAITRETPEFKIAIYLVLWMVILAVGRGVFMLARTVFYILSNYVVSTMLRRNVFRNILERRGARPLGNSTGDVVSRFRDDVDKFTAFIQNVGYYGSFFLFCLVGLAIMWSIDQTVTWIVMIPFVVIGIMVTLVKPRIQSLTSKERASTASVTGFIGTSFANVESIKAACAEPQVVTEFRNRNQARRAAVIRQNVFSALIAFLGDSMYIIGMAVFLAAVATRMRDGTFSVGEFALFAHFISYLGAGMHGLTRILVDYKGLPVNIGRLEEIMTEAREDELVDRFSPGFTQEDVTAKKREIAPAGRVAFEKLSVKGLSYTYPHSKDGISGIDFEIRSGEIVVLAGEVGSGKTTLIRCVLGHLSPDKGAVFWNEEQVVDPARFFIPDRCVYIPQRPRLFSDTLEANVLQGKLLEPPQTEQIMSKAQLLSELDRLDNGLDTQVGPNGVKLSGGQAQRVALARMFANPSNLMIGDDPVRGLDIDTEKSFWDDLQVKGNEAFVFCTNSRLALERADRVIVLKQGRIVEAGCLSDLLRQGCEMRRIWSTNSD